MLFECYGFVIFNLKEKIFLNCFIDFSDFVFNFNDMVFVVLIDDSFMFVIVYNWGMGLLNCYICVVYWLRVFVFLQFGVYKLFLDDIGYGWMGIGGKLFILDCVIVFILKGIFKLIIDVIDFFVNEIKKGMFFLEVYFVYCLGEYERNIELIFFLIQVYVFDFIWYEY